MEYKLTFEDGSDGYLAHYGVLGMKWGVRNAETKERYQRGKGGSRQYVYEEYKKAGYSDADAKRLSNGHAALKKALIAGAVVGGVAITATIGIAAYNRYGNRVLKAGSVLQTVHKADTKAADRISREAFYASSNKVDNHLYAKRFTDHLSDKPNPTNYAVSKILVGKDIKIAAERTARKEFEELCRTNSHFYARMRNNYVSGGGVLGVRNTNLPEDVTKVSERQFKQVYENFNRGLIRRTPERTVFYNHMRSKGYGGVLDINDAKVAGWTFRPTIIFDNAGLSVQSTSRITSKDVTPLKKAGAVALEKLRTHQNHPMLMALSSPETGLLIVSGAGIASMYADSNRDRKARIDFAEQYRKEHPGTKKTNAQLKQMYEKEQFDKYNIYE